MNLYFFEIMRTMNRYGPASALERAAAADALARLRDGATLRMEGDVASDVMPEFVVGCIVTLLEAFAAGEILYVSTWDQEVGTQQAAAFLKVSRPTVAKMMDEGRLRFRKAGKHRRVRLADLIAFESRLTRNRQAAVEDLAALGQDMILQARQDGTFRGDMM